MSRDWVQDIQEMHTKYGVREVVRNFDALKLWRRPLHRSLQGRIE